MKLFRVVLDDSKDVFCRVIAAESKKDMLEAVKDNGEVIKVTDVTMENTISIEEFSNILKSSDFSDNMQKLLFAMYENHVNNVK